MLTIVIYHCKFITNTDLLSISVLIPYGLRCVEVALFSPVKVQAMAASLFINVEYLPFRNENFSRNWMRARHDPCEQFPMDTGDKQWPVKCVIVIKFEEPTSLDSTNHGVRSTRAKILPLAFKFLVEMSSCLNLNFSRIFFVFAHFSTVK